MLILLSYIDFEFSFDPHAYLSGCEPKLSKHLILEDLLVKATQIAKALYKSLIYDFKQFNDSQLSRVHLILGL